MDQVVDLDKYPLLEAESAKYRDLVRRHRQELARKGEYFDVIVNFFAFFDHRKIFNPWTGAG